MALPSIVVEFYFLLDQKVTKNQVGGKASLRSLPLRTKDTGPKAWNFLPWPTWIFAILQWQKFRYAFCLPTSQCPESFLAEAVPPTGR